MLREKRGIEFGAKRHQLRFDALQKRRAAQRREHFRQQFFRHRRLRVLRGNEKTADQTFVIFDDVEAIARRLAVFDCDIAPQRPRVNEFADQIDGGPVIPVQFLAPMPSLLLKQSLERARIRLAKINNLHEGCSTTPETL